MGAVRTAIPAKKGNSKRGNKHERLQLASDGKWATLIQMLWDDIEARDEELRSKHPAQKGKRRRRRRSRPS